VADSWIFCFWFDKLTIAKYLTRSNLTDSVHLSHFDYKMLKVLRKLQVFAFSPHSGWPLRGLRQPSVRILSCAKNKVTQYIHTGFFYFLCTNNSSPSLEIFATSSSLMTERVGRPGSLFSVVRKHCSASQKRKRAKQFALFGLTLLCTIQDSRPTVAGAFPPRFARTEKPFESCRS